MQEGEHHTVWVGRVRSQRYTEQGYWTVFSVTAVSPRPQTKKPPSIPGWKHSAWISRPIKFISFFFRISCKWWLYTWANPQTPDKLIIKWEPHYQWVYKTEPVCVMTKNLSVVLTGNPKTQLSSSRVVTLALKSRQWFLLWGQELQIKDGTVWNWRIGG